MSLAFRITNPRIRVRKQFSERKETFDARARLAEDFADGWLAAVNVFRKGIDLDRVAEAFEAGVGPLAMLDALQIARFDSLLHNVISIQFGAGIRAGAELANQFGREEIIKATVPIGSLPLDLVEQFAVQFIENETGALVARLGKTTAEGVADTLTQAITEQLTPDQAARKIADQVGLTRKQTRAVNNFGKKVRDTARASGRSGESRAVEREIQRYRKRLMLQRGEMLAKHEMQKALVAGERGMWEVRIAEEGLSKDQVMRMWVTSDPCPICEPLDGLIAPMGESFQGYFEPPIHILCKCYLEYTLRRAEAA